MLFARVAATDLATILSRCRLPSVMEVAAGEHSGLAVTPRENDGQLLYRPLTGDAFGELVDMSCENAWQLSKAVWKRVWVSFSFIELNKPPKAAVIVRACTPLRHSSARLEAAAASS